MLNPVSAPAKAQAAIGRMRYPNWLREPLLHFVLLGGLLFAVDHLVSGRSDDPRTITVDAKVDGEARQVFKAARGREPNEEELYALRRVWLDNEVLYREGLALQVDKGDTAIRDRVIFKALSVIDAGLKLPPVNEKVLREWFESNRAKYDEPARYDFEEAVLAGEVSESDLRAFAANLNAGNPGDANASLRVFKGRPRANLVQSYGEEFAKALEASPVGEWRVLSTSGGLRVLRLQAIVPAKPAAFESLAGVVMHDWTDAVMAEQRTAAVRTLAQKYTVKVEAASP
ncbi:MAG: peptidyl-prolyl cis-trans isomerase [Burkholderiales bacterium]|nr:peptidyl-prolyl cis-trans isomerase [Burkholderiales bacterium]